MPCSVIKKLRGHGHGIGEKFAYASLIICIFLFYCSFLETKPTVMNMKRLYTQHGVGMYTQHGVGSP